MRIGSIFFVFLGLGLLLGIPKSRKWLTKSLLNNRLLRRLSVRMGMSIPFIRKRVVREAMQGL